MKNLLTCIIIFFCFLTTACDTGKIRKVIYESKIKADSIIVDKTDKKVFLLKGGKVIREYDANFGPNALKGKKRFEGDDKTPEGSYFIANKNPNSQYFLSLLVSYPNKEDIEYAKSFGKSAGGEIMIHGMPNKAGWLERLKDQYNNWTAGCIAVKDKDMIEIYAMVDVGTPILIRR